MRVAGFPSHHRLARTSYGSEAPIVRLGWIFSRLAPAQRLCSCDRRRGYVSFLPTSRVQVWHLWLSSCYLPGLKEVRHTSPRNMKRDGEGPLWRVKR